MGADLDRSITGVGDLDREGRTTSIEFDLASGRKQFAWNHAAILKVDERARRSGLDDRIEMINLTLAGFIGREGERHGRLV
jgi:hypothetical protein